MVELKTVELLQEWEKEKPSQVSHHCEWACGRGSLVSC